ncbi:glycosyltransferase family 4 protein [Microlunatus aurantiacus]|uniref:Glycosyltransferase family 4 protein n=1 Tax=Microlunatus aurantiacus TaxID=446786 RepID=A0ABP7DUE1_9ACTN
MTTLVVTNDFPPRIGGIESFVAHACRFLDDDVAVLTSTAPGADAFDAAAGFPVERLPGPLLPGPRAASEAVDLLRRTGADRVLFGAAAPLALLAPALRAAGAERIVALTHGHETWWATLPGSRALLRRIGDEVDVLTTISDYVTDRISAALSPAGRAKLVRLPPPVDLDVFRHTAPSSGAPATTIAEIGTEVGAARVVGVGRMVRRKGFDTLLQAWARLPGPAVRTSSALGPELVLVGDGPERPRLERQVRREGIAGVVFTGALDQAGVLAALRRSDVFALPYRSRLGGLDPEGLGLAALEAAACGIPVVVGRSGGAPETVRHGRTGYVVAPDDPYELAARLGDLLSDPQHARALGAAGRGLVAERYGAAQARRVLRAALDLPDVATV